MVRHPQGSYTVHSTPFAVTESGHTGEPIDAFDIIILTRYAIISASQVVLSKM